MGLLKAEFELVIRDMCKVFKTVEETIDDANLVNFLDAEMLLKLRTKTRVHISVDFVSSQQTVPNFAQPAQKKSSVLEFKGWWAYEVDPNDSNYHTRNFPQLDCVFYDSDQNFQIEMHYSQCVSGVQPFGKTQTITGDQNKKQNGFAYDAWGSSARAGLHDTTWRQKNLTHSAHRERRIFRFDSSTPQF